MSRSLKPFRCKRCIAKNTARVFIPGVTLPFRFLILSASEEVALSIAATPIEYLYILAIPRKNRLSFGRKNSVSSPPSFSPG